MRLIILDPHGHPTSDRTVTGSRDHYDTISSDENCCINFGCTTGRCGACLIKTDNVHAFLSPTEKEAKTLTMMNAKPNERLVCVSELRVELSGTVCVWNAFSVYNPIKR